MFRLLIPSVYVLRIPIFLFIVSILSLNPLLGLIVYLSCLTLNPQTFSELLINMHFTRVVAIFVMVLALVRIPMGEIKSGFAKNQSKILLILLFIILASVFLGIGWRVKVMDVFGQMAKNVVLYFLIVVIINSRNKLRGAIWAWLIFLSILAVNTIHASQALGPEASEALRLGGYDNSYLGGAGDFAVMMNVAFALAFFMFFAERNIIFKIVSLSLAIVFIFAMSSTYARGGGVIAFFGTCILIVVLGIKSRSWFQKVLCIVLPIILVVGLFAYSPENFIERMNTIKDFRSGTGGARIEFWKIGLAMCKYNPILGVGPGNYPLQYHNYGGWEPGARVSHNMFIEMISEMGLVGFGLLMMLLFYSFKEIFASNKLLEAKGKVKEMPYFISQGLFCALAAYCLGGMFQSILKYPFLYLILGLIVANNNIVEREATLE